jgi:hypothetical protein
MEENASTLTLPAATLNRFIGVICNTGVKEVKLTASAGKIFSRLHPAGATTVVVTESSAILVEADGTNWWAMAPTEKPEDAYSALTERAAGTLFEPSATRPVHVLLQVKAKKINEPIIVAVSAGGVILATVAAGSTTGESIPRFPTAL